MTKTQKSIYLVILPILIGGLIYTIFGKTTLQLFKWIRKLGLEEVILDLRNCLNVLNPPKWVIYNLPDFLWIFASTSLLLIIWDFKITKQNLIYILVPFLLAVGSEICQKIGYISGTYDNLDFVAYLVGFIISVTLVSDFKNE